MVKEVTAYEYRGVLFKDRSTAQALESEDIMRKELTDLIGHNATEAVWGNAAKVYEALGKGLNSTAEQHHGLRAAMHDKFSPETIEAIIGRAGWLGNALKKAGFA